MVRPSLLLLVSVLLAPTVWAAEQAETYDYWQPQREMIRRGQQALFMCNGLFTSHRTLEQVFAQELAFLPQPVGTPTGGDYEVDRARRTIAVGAASGATPVMRAAFREGLGCVVLAPDQSFATVDDLPKLDLPPPPGDPARIRVAGRRPRRGCSAAGRNRRSHARRPPPTGRSIASRRSR